jgi:hypothetical protein
MTMIRLVTRQHRVSVIFVALFSLGLAAAAVEAWAAFSGLIAPPHCLENLEAVACEGSRDFLVWNQELAETIMPAMAVLPLLGGIVLGVPLLGSELETRTATIAWSLGASRRRWLIVRLAILGIGLIAVLTVATIAAEILEGERHALRGYLPGEFTFDDYGLHGPLVLLRGLAAFSIGVLVGLVLGRVLPALLVALVAVALLWWGVDSARWMGWPEPEILVEEAGHYYMQFGFGPDAAGDGTGWVDAAEQRVTWDQIVARSPIGYRPDDEDFDSNAFDSWVYENFRPITLAIPGQKLRFVEWREGAGLAALTIVLLGTSVLAIERKRPT